MEGIHYTNKHYNGGQAYIREPEAARAKALRDFRLKKEAEKSEFAVEFARLKQGGYKPAFGILETVGLTPLLVGCQQAMREAAVELLWIECPGGSWAAACLQGDCDRLEQGLAQGLAAAKRFDEGAMYYVFRDPPPALARWFRLGRGAEPWEVRTNMKQMNKRAQGEQAPEDSRENLREEDLIREDLKRRVELQNAANMLEYTDTELRELIRQNLSDPEQLPPGRLNSMHKEELVDYYNQMQHGRLN